MGAGTRPGPAGGAPALSTMAGLEAGGGSRLPSTKDMQSRRGCGRRGREEPGRRGGAGVRASGRGWGRRGGAERGRRGGGADVGAGRSPAGGCRGGGGSVGAECGRRGVGAGVGASGRGCGVGAGVEEGSGRAPPSWTPLLRTAADDGRGARRLVCDGLGRHSADKVGSGRRRAGRRPRHLARATACSARAVLRRHGRAHLNRGPAGLLRRVFGTPGALRPDAPTSRGPLRGP